MQASVATVTTNQSPRTSHHGQEGLMSTPVTTLDRRYSNPDASPTSWDTTCRVIEAAELFWLTSVRTDGRPHVTPVVAVWLDNALHFTAGAGEQKAANLRDNAHVILTTGCNGWQEGVDVVLEGDAVLVTDGAALERLGVAWRAKWDGRWQYYAQDGRFHHPDGFEVLPYVVAPTKVLAFAKGTFSHTVHRFPVA
jgi:general stress protein 26